MQLAQLLFDGSLLLLFAGGCGLMVHSLRPYRHRQHDRPGSLVGQIAEEKTREVLDAPKVALARPATFPATAVTWDIPVVEPDGPDKNRLASSVSAAVVKSRKTAAGAPPVSN
jgi:hypothetical protein